MTQTRVFPPARATAFHIGGPVCLALFVGGCAHDLGPSIAIRDPRLSAVWSTDERSSTSRLVCNDAPPTACKAEIARFTQLLGADTLVEIVRNENGSLVIPRNWDDCILCSPEVVVVAHDGTVAPSRNWPEGPFVNFHREGSADVSITVSLRIDRVTWLRVILVTKASNLRSNGVNNSDVIQALTR